jgi:hypothetical protein
MSKTRLTNVSADDPAIDPHASKRDELLRRLLHTPPQPLAQPALSKSRKLSNGTTAEVSRELDEPTEHDDDDCS